MLQRLTVLAVCIKGSKSQKLLHYLFNTLTFVLCAGFWLKVTSYNEQPNVHFTYETLVVMTTSGGPGDYITWSTLQNYNQLEMHHLRIPTLQV